jgi:predicted transcriptional regulator
MGKYRNRLEIIADVLEIVSNGAKKTQIMYGANLSYTLLCRYLEAVMNLNLVQEGEGSVYRLTEKGHAFIQAFTDYQERRVEAEERLTDVNHEELSLVNRFLTPYLESRAADS